MKIKLELILDVESEESASAVCDRLGILDYDSLIESFDDVCDEVVEINSIELDDIYEI